MSHTAKALILHCMDFRFIHEIVHFMKREGLIDQYDDLGLAGGAKNLADPTEPSDREVVLREIELAKNLHGVSTVYLINHRDCGAYGKAFASPQAETERHNADLRKAKDLLKGQFPDLQVKTILATLQEPGRVEFETIVENQTSR